MKNSHDITRRSDGPGGRPFECEHLRRLAAHPTRPMRDGFDRSVDRLDHAKADQMIAIGRDPRGASRDAPHADQALELPPTRGSPGLDDGERENPRAAMEAVDLSLIVSS